MDNCKICGKKFRRHYRRSEERQVYCSKACRFRDFFIFKTCKTCGCKFKINSLNSKGRGKKYCSLACTQRRPCKLCGSIVKGRNKSHGKARVFCSKKCSGIFNAYAKGTISYVIKGFLQCLKRFGEIRCERCGFKKSTHALVVHHINRDRSDRSFSNLVVLCNNCHALEHWNRSATRLSESSIALRLHLQE